MWQHNSVFLGWQLRSNENLRWVHAIIFVYCLWNMIVQLIMKVAVNMFVASWNNHPIPGSYVNTSDPYIHVFEICMFNVLYICMHVHKYIGWKRGTSINRLMECDNMQSNNCLFQCYNYTTDQAVQKQYGGRSSWIQTR